MFKALLKHLFFILEILPDYVQCCPFLLLRGWLTLLYLPWIDYCNALLAGASKATLNKLQVVQNSAARILTRTRMRDHITPVLESLHWLPVSFRVDFKILMLTYKALHGLAPQYLSELLIPYTPTRDLRSSETGLLTVPLTRLRSMGDRAFSSLAPKLWNSLPIEIRQAKTISTFKSRLKTHFFK